MTTTVPTSPHNLDTAGTAGTHTWIDLDGVKTTSFAKDNDQAAQKRTAKILDRVRQARVIVPPNYRFAQVRVAASGRSVDLCWEAPEFTNAAGDSWLRVSLEVGYDPTQHRYLAMLSYCSVDGGPLMTITAGRSPMARRAWVAELPGVTRFNMGRFLQFLDTALIELNRVPGPDDLPNDALTFFGAGKQVIASKP